MKEILLATVVLFFVFVHQIHGYDSSKCYLDVHDGKLSGADEGGNCDRSEEFTVGCEDFRGKHTPFDWETDEENFVITAVEWRTDPKHSLEKKTVLSVTISNISFHELDIRLEDRTNPPTEGEYCQMIKFDKNQLPHEITLHILAWSGRRTQIQFIGHRNERSFFREFHFLAPSHFALSNTEEIEDNRIFAYIDTTYFEKVRLYVEPLPKNFDVDYYIGQLRQKNGTTDFVTVEEFNLTDEPLVYNVSVHTSGASYDFQLTPVVTGTNCSATQTAVFNMWEAQTARFNIWRTTPFAVFLLIFFSVTIPVALFFILRRVYIWQRNRVWGDVKVHLLMIYNPTHPSHIEAVDQLALYLKNCNIHVMIDRWGIEERQDRNPNRWCDESFEKAEIVVVVSSPPETCHTGRNTEIYGPTQDHFIRLIVQNYPLKDTEDKYKKRYVSVLLPYCEKTDLPPEAIKFELFNVPKQSKELVNYCHNTDYTDMFNKWKNNQELIRSIEIAKLYIKKGQRISRSNNHNELREVTLSTGEVREDDNDYTESDGSSRALVNRISTKNRKS